TRHPQARNGTMRKPARTACQSACRGETMIEIREKPASGQTIRLHENDNVLVARGDLALGAKLEAEGLTCRSQVPSGHKIAAGAITKADPIPKYNVVVGFAPADIPAGTLVHMHNTEFREFQRDYAYCADYQPVEYVPEDKRASFMGI